MKKTMDYDNQGMVDCLRLDGYAAKRYQMIADFFRDQSGQFLDVGCCQGELKKYLHPGLTYHGIDNADNDFEEFTKVDLNSKELPFADKAFDAVNCSAVLEHLLYPLEMLRELSRILKDDGKVLISLPNDKSLNALYAQLFLPIPTYEQSVFGHHWRFSIQTARQFFEKEFEIMQEAPEFGPLFRKYLPFLKLKVLCTEWFMLGVKRRPRSS